MEEKQVIDIVLVTYDRKKRLSVDLSASDNLSTLKSKWSQVYKCAQDSFRVLSPDGMALPEDISLKTFNESIVRLWVEEKQEIKFALYKQISSDTESVRLSLSSRPADLSSTLREKFSIAASRNYRLINSQGTVLADQETFQTANVTEESTIFIDIEIRVNLVNKWNNQRITHDLLFASDNANKLLLSIPEACRAQFYFRGKQLDLHGDFVDFFQQVKGLDESSKIDVDMTVPVASIARGLVEHFEACSKDSIADIVNLPQRSSSSVTLDGAILSTERNCLEAEVKPCDLLVLDQKKVVVKFGKKCLRTVRVSRDAVLQDLVKKVASISQKPCHEIELRLGGQILNDPTFAIRNLTTTKRECLTVIHKPFHLTIEIDDETLEVHPSQASINRDDIVGFLLKKRLITRGEGRTMTLKCLGCHRRLQPDLASEQAIPSDCCGLASKFLKIKRKKVQGGHNGSRVRDGCTKPWRAADEGPQPHQKDGDEVVYHNLSTANEGPQPQRKDGDEVMYQNLSTADEGPHPQRKDGDEVAPQERRNERNEGQGPPVPRRPPFRKAASSNAMMLQPVLKKEIWRQHQIIEDDDYAGYEDQREDEERQQQSMLEDDYTQFAPRSAADKGANTREAIYVPINQPTGEHRRQNALRRAATLPESSDVPPTQENPGEAPRLPERQTHPAVPGPPTLPARPSEPPTLPARPSEAPTLRQRPNVPPVPDNEQTSTGQKTRVFKRADTLPSCLTSPPDLLTTWPPPLAAAQPPFGAVNLPARAPGSGSSGYWKGAFCFRNLSKVIKGGDFHAKLTLKVPPTIGDLRQAVAIRCKVQPASFYFEGLRGFDSKGELWIAVKHPEGQSHDNWCSNQFSCTRRWEQIFNVYAKPIYERLPDEAILLELREELSICLTIQNEKKKSKKDIRKPKG